MVSMRTSTLVPPPADAGSPEPPWENKRKSILLTNAASGLKTNNLMTTDSCPVSFLFTQSTAATRQVGLIPVLTPSLLPIRCSWNGALQQQSVGHGHQKTWWKSWTAALRQVPRKKKDMQHTQLTQKYNPVLVPAHTHWHIFRPPTSQSHKWSTWNGPNRVVKSPKCYPPPGIKHINACMHTY